MKRQLDAEDQVQIKGVAKQLVKIYGKDIVQSSLAMFKHPGNIVVGLFNDDGNLTGWQIEDPNGYIVSELDTTFAYPAANTFQASANESNVPVPTTKHRTRNWLEDPTGKSGKAYYTEPEPEPEPEASPFIYPEREPDINDILADMQAEDDKTSTGDSKPSNADNTLLNDILAEAEAEGIPASFIDDTDDEVDDAVSKAPQKAMPKPVVKIMSGSSATKASSIHIPKTLVFDDELPEEAPAVSLDDFGTSAQPTAETQQPPASASYNSNDFANIDFGEFEEAETHSEQEAVSQPAPQLRDQDLPTIEQPQAASVSTQAQDHPSDGDEKKKKKHPIRGCFIVLLVLAALVVGGYFGYNYAVSQNMIPDVAAPALSKIPFLPKTAAPAAETRNANENGNASNEPDAPDYSKFTQIGDNAIATIEVKEGMLATDVRDALAKAGCVSAAKDFYEVANSSGKANKIQLGTYKIRGGESAKDIFNRMLESKFEPDGATSSNSAADAPTQAPTGIKID